jgi:hypothetical protein
MPATLNEAYATPFHNFTRGTQASSSNTADIRASLPMTSHSQPASGHAFAMPTDYRIAKPGVDTDDEIQSIYNSLREPSTAQMALQTQAAHDCNELISRIMSCPICRTKLLQILSHEERPVSSGKTQMTGGAAGFSLEGMWPVMGNFIIGIAVIILIDKIVKLRA